MGNYNLNFNENDYDDDEKHDDSNKYGHCSKSIIKTKPKNSKKNKPADCFN